MSDKDQNPEWSLIAGLFGEQSVLPSTGKKQRPKLNRVKLEPEPATTQSDSLFDFFGDNLEQPSRDDQQSWLARRRGKRGSLINRLSRAAALAPSDYSLPTRHEVHQAYAALQAKLAKAEASYDIAPEATSLLLSILTGRNAAELAGDTGLWCGNLKLTELNGQTHSVFALDLPEKGIIDLAAQLVDRRPTGAIHIPLPLSVAKAARWVIAAELPMPSEHPLLETLNSMRSLVARPLIEARLTAYLASQLRADGVDEALASALLGARPEDAPQLSYARIKHKDLLAAYRKIIEPLHSLAAEEVEWNAVSPHLHVGSTLVPQPKILTEIFGILSQRIVAAAKGHTPANIALHHNLLAAKTLITLQIATTHRSVIAPFERISDFDRSVNLVCLADKMNRGTHNERLIKIGPIARLALDHWLKHLSNANWFLASQSPKVAEAARNALANQGPLLFLIRKNRPYPLEPSIVSKLMAATLLGISRLSKQLSGWTPEQASAVQTAVYTKSQDKRDVFWALAVFIGHSDPGQTFQSYLYIVPDIAAELRAGQAPLIFTNTVLALTKLETATSRPVKLRASCSTPSNSGMKL